MTEYNIYVYGASDDLVEVGGDVSEEFYADLGEPTHVFVGDTEIVAEYTDDGEWSVSVVDEGEDDETHWYSVGREKVVEKLNDYTEVVVVETENSEVSKLDA